MVIQEMIHAHDRQIYNLQNNISEMLKRLSPPLATALLHAFYYFQIKLMYLLLTCEVLIHNTLIIFMVLIVSGSS